MEGDQTFSQPLNRKEKKERKSSWLLFKHLGHPRRYTVSMKFMSQPFTVHWADPVFPSSVTVAVWTGSQRHTPSAALRVSTQRLIHATTFTLQGQEWDIHRICFSWQLFKHTVSSNKCHGSKVFPADRCIFTAL